VKSHSHAATLGSGEGFNESRQSSGIDELQTRQVDSDLSMA